MAKQGEGRVVRAVLTGLLIVGVAGPLSSCSRVSVVSAEGATPAGPAYSRTWATSAGTNHLLCFSDGAEIFVIGQGKSDSPPVVLTRQRKGQPWVVSSELQIQEGGKR